MNKTLILETYPFSPHLEISGEIALNKKFFEKQKVFFGWLGDDLKWAEWHQPTYKKFIFSYKKRIRYFQDIIEKKGINLINIKKFEINTKDIEKWSEEFSGNLNDLKKYTFKKKNLGIGVASSLISYCQESEPDLGIHKSIVKKSLYSSAYVYRLARKILVKYKPNTLVTFNGRFATSNAISLAAKDLKIKTIFHERGSNLYKYELFEGNLHSNILRKKLIKNYWKKEKNKKIKNKIANEFFLSRRKGTNKDSLGMSFRNSKKPPNIKLLKNQKIYTYFSSTSYEWDALIDFTKKEWNNEYHAIKNLISETNKLKHKIKLIIRLHPFNKKLKNFKDIKKIKSLANKNNILLFDEHSNIDSYELIKKSYAIITYGSTIGAEAVFLCKPSISMRNCYYQSKDTVYSALNLNQLKEVLRKNKLKIKSVKSILPFAYYMSIFGNKFKYYKPNDYFNGLFLGKSILPYPKITKFIVSNIRRFL